MNNTEDNWHRFCRALGGHTLGFPTAALTKQGFQDYGWTNRRSETLELNKDACIFLNIELNVFKAIVQVHCESTLVDSI